MNLPPPPHGHFPPPKQTMSTGTKVTLGVVAGTVALCGLCGFGAALAPDSPSRSTVSTLSAVAPETPVGAAGREFSTTTIPPLPTIGASRDNLAPVGTEVGPAKGWTVKVVRSGGDATSEIVSASMINEPDVGNRLVSVRVDLRNHTDRPSSPLLDLDIGALTPGGAKIGRMLFVAGYPTIELSTQTQPGGAVSGNLVFEVEAADVEGLVLLAEPRFTLDENEDQRFLAIREGQS